MQNVICGARPDRALMPFCWADRSRGPATTLFQMHRCGGRGRGHWCLSFGEKHLSDAPTPSSLPVYLNGRNKLLSEYWMLPSPTSCIRIGASMEDGGLEGKDHILLTFPLPLHSGLDQARCLLCKHEPWRNSSPILMAPLIGSSQPYKEPAASYSMSTPL